MTMIDQKQTWWPRLIRLAVMGLSQALCWALLAAWPLAGRAADVPGVADAVPADAFFRPPAMSKPMLSPNGERLAVHVTAPDGRQRLAVLSVAPPRKAKIIAGFQDADIGDVEWVNDDRLVFDIVDRGAAWADRYGSGLFAVDADGQGMRALMRRRWDAEKPGIAITSRELDPNHWLMRVLRDGSADVMIARPMFNARHELISVVPLRVNTQNGLAQSTDAGLGRSASRWRLDDAGVPRLAWVRDGANTEVLWRASAGAPWLTVGTGATFGDGGSGVFNAQPLGADGEIYTATRRGDDGALRRFDASTLKLRPEPVLSIKDFEFTGRLLFDQRAHRLIGARFTSDARGTAWFDARMQQVQARVDKKLPGSVNLIDPAECGCSRWMVVTSFTDRQPDTYWLYDSDADEIDLVGSSRPAIDPKRMAERDFVRIATRDGRQMPVHVTRPVGKGPWPMVVLVHGGPFVRGGDWRWDADSQFLASRGYVVVEPEFRGSTGYGWAHFRAGWQQWGLAMQDDIADAARWAIKQGDADAQRVCIAGASYGGYATLMGLVRDPDLYRCGVAWAAVTDLRLMYDITYSDLPEIYRLHGMPKLIGDRERDAAQLAATSPLAQAARITRPLLLVHGGDDRRVPVVHATRLRDALTDLKRPPEWKLYADEGHGFFNPDNRIDFMQRVERFLAVQLAPR